MHVSYYDAAQRQLRYARRDGRGWSRELVEASVDVGESSQLASGRDGSVHVAYWDAANWALRVAQRTAAGWSVRCVDGSDRDLSIATDGSGRPHLAYRHPTLGLRYGRWDGAAWRLETIHGGRAGWNVRLAVALDGTPHVVHRDGDLRALRYAVKGASGWSSETIEAAGNPGWDLSVAVDRQGRPHVAYRNLADGALKYATSAGIWSIETVDAGGPRAPSGRWASIAVSTQGPVFISYSAWDVEGGRYALKLAKRASPWTIQTVEGGGAEHGALGLDASGEPVLAYAAQAGEGYELRVVTLEPSAAAVDLSQAGAFPNPFSPSRGHTRITFDRLPEGASVRVFTLTGLVLAELTADASGQAVWNVRNLSGVPVSSGVYHVQIKAKGSASRLLKVAVER